MEVSFEQIVHSSLNYFCLDNAVFIAERYAAHCKNDPKVLNLLATCYIQSGKYMMAYDILKKATSSESKYLFAIAAWKSGHLREAISALKPSSDILDDVPNGAYGLYALGAISIEQGQFKKAAEYLKKSLDINPFLWSAYEALCNIGENVEISNFLKEDKPSQKDLYQSVKTPGRTVKKTTTSRVQKATSPVKTPISLSIEEKTFVTPSESSVMAPPPVQKKKASQKTSSIHSSSSRTLFKEVSTPKRSIRLQKKNETQQSSTIKPSSTMSTRSSLKSRSSLKTPSTNKTVITDHEPQTPAPKSNDILPKEKPQPSHLSILNNILKHFGDGYRFLSQYQCQKALKCFEKLPPNQFNTGRVLCEVGKTYYEMTHYQKAKTTFEKIRKIQPYQVRGMEYYSTILWHDKKFIDLSFLANELTEVDHLSPQVWCVVGNCFSIQKKHNVAIRFFERAIQLQPRFTYAYTLIGHEFMAQENWDKAILYFRDAIRIDPRHYNAWYGLGMVYNHQGRFDYAEYHFKKAVEIHQHSSVLFCSVGIVLIGGKRINEALQYFDKSLEIDPHNPLSRYKKAYVLYLLGYQEESIQELEELKYYAPKDASIFYLLGKMYRQMKIPDKAMDNLSQALELEPKNPDPIKKALEDLKNNVDDGEEDYSAIFELQHA